MTSAIGSVAHPIFTPNAPRIGAKILSFLSSTIKKILIISAQFTAGLLFGACSPLLYAPLTGKILKILGIPQSRIGGDPLHKLCNPKEIVWNGFYVCMLGPILEELLFRGPLMSKIKGEIEVFCIKQGASKKRAKLIARILTIVSTSLLFGVAHLYNAIAFKCSPLLFLPQVISATIMGLLFGIAKELTDGITTPIGMHIGNNSLAWAALVQRL
ncbi:MAG: CPBP family intramembrane metalloprotease [Chlamydia sp.]